MQPERYPEQSMPNPPMESDSVPVVTHPAIPAALSGEKVVDSDTSVDGPPLPEYGGLGAHAISAYQDPNNPRAEF